MSSSPIVNPLIRASARIAPRNGYGTRSQVSQRPRRTYATEGPHLPKYSTDRKKAFMIAGLVGIPALVYFMTPPRGAKPGGKATHPPNLDPVARKRAQDENAPRYEHPEQKNPDEFKPEFGQLHKPKRVDTPPDGRHHQALADRERVN